MPASIFCPVYIISKGFYFDLCFVFNFKYNKNLERNNFFQNKVFSDRWFLTDIRRLRRISSTFRFFFQDSYAFTIIITSKFLWSSGWIVSIRTPSLTCSIGEGTEWCQTYWLYAIAIRHSKTMLNTTKTHTQPFAYLQHFHSIISLST